MMVHPLCVCVFFLQLLTKESEVLHHETHDFKPKYVLPPPLFWNIVFEFFIWWLMHALCAYFLVTESSASRCAWQQQPIGAPSSACRSKAPIIQAMKGRSDAGAVDRAAALLVRCLCTSHLLSALSTTPINRIQQPRTQPSGPAGTCSSPQNCCKKEVWRVLGARSSTVGTARTR
jgi:hypothetical protein